MRLVSRSSASWLATGRRRKFATTGPPGFAAYLRGDLWLDVTENLSELGIPVWLAWGRQSKNPPVDHADLWLHHLPEADLEVFQGAGALPHAETPALFCRALERFLAGLPD